MEILGIGFSEFMLIVLIILILFGPKEMVKTGKTLGQWLNRLARSPTYKVLTKTSEELKNLPRNLMREANLEEFQEEIRQINKDAQEQAKAIGSPMSNAFNQEKFFNTSGRVTQPGDIPAKPDNEKSSRITAPELPKDERE